MTRQSVQELRRGGVPDAHDTVRGSASYPLTIRRPPIESGQKVVRKFEESGQKVDFEESYREKGTGIINNGERDNKRDDAHQVQTQINTQMHGR